MRVPQACVLNRFASATSPMCMYVEKLLMKVYFNSFWVILYYALLGVERHTLNGYQKNRYAGWKQMHQCEINGSIDAANTRCGAQVASGNGHCSRTRGCSPWSTLTNAKTANKQGFQTPPPSPNTINIRRRSRFGAEPAQAERLLISWTEV